MAPYTVRYGETISDCVMNSTGNIANWPLILDENGFDDWTPALYAGQILQIPDTVVIDQNVLRQLALYPANNQSVPNIDDLIQAVFGDMNPNDWILQDGTWNDNGYWRDRAVWNDGV